MIFLFWPQIWKLFLLSTPFTSPTPHQSWCSFSFALLVSTQLWSKLMAVANLHCVKQLSPRLLWPLRTPTCRHVFVFYLQGPSLQVDILFVCSFVCPSFITSYSFPYSYSKLTQPPPVDLSHATSPTQLEHYHIISFGVELCVNLTFFSQLSIQGLNFEVAIGCFLSDNFCPFVLELHSCEEL